MWDPSTAKNEYAHGRFLHECPQRLPVNRKPVCAVLGLLTDIAVEIDPRTCGRCRLNGEINHDFLKNRAFQILHTKLQDAWLGFHNGPAHILDLAERAMLCSAPESTQRGLVEEALYLSLSLARVELKDVLPILNRRGYKPEHPLRKKLQTASELSVNAPAQPVALDAPCGGCMSKKENLGANLFQTVKAMIDASTHALAALAGDKLAQQEYSARESICRKCEATDSMGEKLFNIASPMRPFTPRPHCGVPFLQQPVRDEKVDGCGCILEAKWAAKDEHCPLDKW